MKQAPEPRGKESVELEAEPASTPEASAERPEALLDSLLERPSAPTKDGLRWSRGTKAGYELQLRDEGGAEGLRIVAPGGHLCVQIRLDPEGPRIEVFGAELHAHADEVVRLAGPRVEIEAEESITLRSGGTIRQQARGNVESEAFEHHLESTHGEIRLVANDDVALDGERIRLNSPPQIRPPHLTNRPRPPRDPRGGEDT